jgi:hypothetical protein
VVSAHEAAPSALLIFVEWNRKDSAKITRTNLDHKLTAVPQWGSQPSTSRNETVRPGWSVAVAVWSATPRPDSTLIN